MAGTGIPFAQQRIVFLMLLVGMALYMVAAAVVLQTNEGRGLGAEPIVMLDQVVIFLGTGLAVAAFTMRAILGRAAANAPVADRAAKRFVAVLVPLAMVEGGNIAGTTTWLLNGNAVPGLVVALVLFALAIVMVPFSDPDQTI